jgi:hypothetical protein
MVVIMPLAILAWRTSSLKGAMLIKRLSYPRRSVRFGLLTFLVTSQGPGTSLIFSLTLIECLMGKEKAQEITK